MTLPDAFKVLVIFQVATILAAFHKYYEFKNFVELLQYKKALAKCKEDFHERISTYRLNLVRPGSMRELKLLMSEGILFQCWNFFFLYSALATMFGSMFQN